ncbi:hypothetical protein M426DRAFT_15976 [Hypoxylon sp. CI-4A]|nr:hypothetical protein M426DRAFT_15976 [Hypoxylon sp. CI-4A]
MAAKAQKISHSSWADQKDAILRLYIAKGLPLNELAQTMGKDHGFNATSSQYEAQLKRWGARKNLRPHEWKGIFPEMDRLASQDIESRVVISGHPVSVDRVNRARRYCKGHRPRKRRREETDLSDAEDNSNLGDAWIEVRNQNGEWSKHIVLAGGETTITQYETSTISLRDSGTQEELIGNTLGTNTPVRTETSRQHENPDQLRANILSPRLLSFHAPGPMSDTWFAVQENIDLSQHMDLSYAGPEAHDTGFLIEHEPWEPENAGTSLVISDLEAQQLRPANIAYIPLGAVSLKDLPFEIFERDLYKRNLKLSIRLSPMQDCRLLSGTQRLAAMFVAEAADVMSKNNERSLMENLHDASLSLKTLDSVFPMNGSESGNGNLSRTSHEVKLHRLLLYSAANGFVGISNIPISAVFKFIDQNTNTTSLLSRWFRDNKGHVAKGLAENLFRAAIEAGDHRIISFLLRTRLIDVNNTVCLAEGRKYTPRCKQEILHPNAILS